MVDFVDGMVPFVKVFAIDGETGVFSDDCVFCHEVCMLLEVATTTTVLCMHNFLGLGSS